MLIVSESGYKSQEEDSVNNKLSEIITSTTNMDMVCFYLRIFNNFTWIMRTSVIHFNI